MKRALLLSCIVFFAGRIIADQGRPQLYQNASYLFTKDYMNIRYYVDPGLDSFYIATAFTSIHLNGLATNFFEAHPSGNYLFLAHRGKMELVYQMTTTDPLDSLSEEMVNYFKWEPEIRRYEVVLSNPAAAGFRERILLLDSSFRFERDFYCPDPHDARFKVIGNDTLLLTMRTIDNSSSVEIIRINNGSNIPFALANTPVSDTLHSLFKLCYYNTLNQTLGGDDPIHTSSADCFFLNKDTLVAMVTQRHTHTIRFMFCTYDETNQQWSNADENQLTLGSYPVNYVASIDSFVPVAENDFRYLNRDTVVIDGLHDGRFYCYDGKEAFISFMDNMTCANYLAHGEVIAVNLHEKTVRVLRDSAFGAVSQALGSVDLVSRTPLKTESDIMRSDVLTCYGASYGDTTKAFWALSIPGTDTIVYVPPGFTPGPNGTGEIELRDSTGKLLLSLTCTLFPKNGLEILQGFKAQIAFPYRAYGYYAPDMPVVNRPGLYCFNQDGNTKVDLSDHSFLLDMYSTGTQSTPIVFDSSSVLLARATTNGMIGKVLSSPYIPTDCIVSSVNEQPSKEQNILFPTITTPSAILNCTKQISGWIYNDLGVEVEKIGQQKTIVAPANPGMYFLKTTEGNISKFVVQ